MTTGDTDVRPVRCLRRPDPCPGHRRGTSARAVLGFDEAKRLDIQLRPGLTFQAKLIDSVSAIPCRAFGSVRSPTNLGSKASPGPDGVVVIRTMLPGRFLFQVDSPAYARWWSDEAVSARNSSAFAAVDRGWRRNSMKSISSCRPPWRL